MNGNEEALFAEALQIHDPRERAAFLDRACAGDAVLRHNIESLLSADAAADFLESPALIATTDEANRRAASTVARAASDSVIGPYRLLEPIGEGGFGVVFVAEQHQPIRRQVALKVIKPGMGSAQVISRFEAERQALALMDHPNIARVLDAGTTEGEPGCVGAGRPYFVMELIRGVPITDYCDQNRLSLRERLELFVTVCRAVQHAHQKGIIHRDIKPSNILVALHDGKAVIKVIDFGIAKALGQALTDRPALTARVQMIGTPLYMSPEQAGMRDLDIDTRSDIYSLGVLLYELLTGATPFDAERLKQVGLDEMCRIIREEEPPRPSARLGTLLDAVSRAAQRQSEPRRLRLVLRGELDWIVMKCLDKDRNRRFETANGLARDVERYLHDEPVLACPPSTVYRLRKFTRRNKRVLVSLGLLAIMLLTVVAVVAGSAGWVVRDQAVRQARLNDKVETAVQDSSGHADRALTLIDRPAQWEAALAEASADLKRAKGLAAGEEGLLDPDLRRRLDALAARLESDQQDRGLVMAVERIRLEGSRPDVKENRFGHAGEVTARYREVFAGCPMTAARPPKEAAALLHGKHAAIRAALIGALDDWLVKATAGSAEREWLAAVLAAADNDRWRTRVRTARRKGYRQVLEALAERPQAHQQSPATLVILADALYLLGATESAIALLRRAQQEHPTDFWINVTLGLRLMEGKRPNPEETMPSARSSGMDVGVADSTRRQAEEAVMFYRVALALRPDNAGVYLNLGNALLAAGDLRGASAALEKAIALAPDYAAAYSCLGNTLRSHNDLPGAIAAYRKAIARDPKHAYYHTNLGTALHDAGDLAGAIAEYQIALRLRRNYATAYLNLGAVLAHRGDLPGAIAAYRKAIEINPNHAVAHNNLGFALSDRGDRRGAIAQYRKAIACDPDLPLAHYNFGNALYQRKDFPAAIAAYCKAIDLAPGWAEARYNLGVARRDNNDLPGAIAAYRQALALKPDYTAAHINLGRALEDSGDLRGAITAFRKGLTACRKALALQKKKGRPPARRKDSANNATLATAYFNLGNVLEKTGNLAESIAAYQQALQLQPKFAEALTNLAVALQAKGDWRAALAATRKAIASNPSYPEAHNNLGFILERTGDRPGAVKAYRKAIACAPKYALGRNNLALLLCRQRNLDEAAAECRTALRHQPGFVNAHNTLGLVLKARGDLDGAIAQFEKALQGKPDYFEALLNLGSARSEQGAYADAAIQFGKARKLQPLDPFPWFYLAMTALATGNLPAHRRACAAALEQLGKTKAPDAANLVLYACVSTPNAVRVPAAFLPLSRVAAQQASFACTPGAALYRAGKYDVAERCFEELARNGQPRAWDYYFLAMAQHRLGKAKEARQALDKAALWLKAAERRKARTKRNPLPWFERVAVEHLRREVEALLGAASETPGKEKAPPRKPKTL
jgi:tetratricopeptide (TPR) repeat protein/serine/threonine protein kinase